MSRFSAIAWFAIGLLGIGPACFAAPVPKDGTFLDLFEPLAEAWDVPTAYEEVTDATTESRTYEAEPHESPTTSPAPISGSEGFLPPSSVGGPIYESPVVTSPGWPAPSACCDASGSGSACSCRNARSRGGWFAEVGASALQSDMSTDESEIWPDGFDPAGEITIGHEWESGFGIRGQAWTFQMEGEIVERISGQSLSLFGFRDYLNYIPGAINQPLYFSPLNVSLASVGTTEIEIDATTLYVDFYRKFQSRYGELTVGFAPAYAHLEFNFPPSGNGVEFDGGGVSLLGEAYVPLVNLWRWELGATGISRFTMLAGTWDVEAASMEVNPSDTMSIAKLAIGPELRFRPNPTADRYCFLRGLAEFQQWRSDQMGPTGGDTLGLHGVSLNGGFLW